MEKKNAGLWQEDKINKMKIQPHSHYLEACVSDLPWMFNRFQCSLSCFSYFLPIFFLNLQLLFFISLAITTQPTPFICSIPSILSPTLYQLLVPLFSSLMALLSIFTHLMWAPHNCMTHRLCYVENLTVCSSLADCLCFAWCSPLTLGKRCVPGWISGYIANLS